MQDNIPDLPRLLQALDRARCRYVLVGGLAALLHGSSLPTNDCDLAVAYDEDNRHRIVQALAPFHPKPLNARNEGEWDEKSVVPPWTLLKTDLGRIDLLIRMHGVDSFEGLFNRSICTTFQGIPIRYASLGDLIAMKDAADRPKDRENLMILRSLQELEDSEED